MCGMALSMISIEGNAGVAGAGDRLQGRDPDALQAELVDRCEGGDHRDRRAVRVLHEGAVPAALVALDLDQVEVTGVDLGDRQRHVGRHAIVR